MTLPWLHPWTRVRLAIRTVVACVTVMAAIFPSEANAQRAILDEYLAFPLALLVDKGQGVGAQATGFFLNGKQGHYLVTAKHVLYNQDGTLGVRATVTGYGADQTDPNPVRMEVDLSGLSQRGFVVADPSDDIVVVKVGMSPPNSSQEPRAVTPWGAMAGVTFKSVPRSAVPGVPLNQIKLFSQVLVSNPVLIFGYPASLNLAPQLDHARPLLRSGIVAGKNEQKHTIIIDCPAYGGNSGGPVIQIETRPIRGGFVRQFSVIGVLAQIVPASVGGNLVNSGYSVVVPMDRVLGTVQQLEKQSGKSP